MLHGGRWNSLGRRVVTQGRENHLILNVDHLRFAMITVEPPEQVLWDERQFHRHASQPK